MAPPVAALALIIAGAHALRSDAPRVAAPTAATASRRVFALPRATASRRVFALEATASRRVAIGGAAAAAWRVAAPPAFAEEDAPIDMDKIRAIAAKRQNVDMSVPRDRDPRDQSLIDVVLGSNGAVLRCTPQEVKEMSRVGFLVKDSFRGRAPDYWSLRDVQPRGWYSEPAARAYGGGLGGALTPADERAADLEALAASLRRSVAEKVAAVAGDAAPERWEAPVADDGTWCGYGSYAAAPNSPVSDDPSPDGLPTSRPRHRGVAATRLRGIPA